MNSLITDIQIKMTDKDYSIMDILRMALVIANKLKADSIKKWIQSELHGYASSDELPEYRKVPMSVKFYNSVYGWCPVDIRNDKFSEVLKEMALRQTISEINELSKNQDTNEVHFDTPLIVKEELSTCAPFDTDFHYVCSSTQLIKIIDIVKTNLLEWAIELEKNGIIDDNSSFEISQVKKSIPINKSTINNFYGDKGKISISQNVT